MTTTTDERLDRFRAMHGYTPRFMSADASEAHRAQADTNVRRLMVDLHDRAAALARAALRIADDPQSANEARELLDQIPRLRQDLSEQLVTRALAGQDAICWRLLDEDGEPA